MIEEIKEIVALLYPRKITNRAYNQEVKYKTASMAIEDYVKKTKNTFETLLLFRKLKELYTLSIIGKTPIEVLEYKSVLLLLKIKDKRCIFRIMKYSPFKGYITYKEGLCIDIIADISVMIETRKLVLNKEKNDR